MTTSLENVKVSKYEKTRAEKFVDKEGKYTSLSKIVTEALSQFNDKLEKEVPKV